MTRAKNRAYPRVHLATTNSRPTCIPRSEVDPGPELSRVLGASGAWAKKHLDTRQCRTVCIERRQIPEAYSETNSRRCKKNGERLYTKALLRKCRRAHTSEHWQYYLVIYQPTVATTINKSQLLPSTMPGASWSPASCFIWVTGVACTDIGATKWHQSGTKADPLKGRNRRPVGISWPDGFRFGFVFVYL